MGRLTEAQRRFLAKIEVADGFLPGNKADMRSHGSLLACGLIGLTYSDGKGGSEPGYVLTPAGRRLLDKKAEER